MPVITPSRFAFANATPVVERPVAVPAVTAVPDTRGNVNIRVNGTTIAYLSRNSGKIVIKYGGGRGTGLPVDSKGRVQVIREKTTKYYTA